MVSGAELQRLKLFGIPAIKTIGDFSFYTHLSEYALYQFSKNAEFHYKVYEVEKKNGKKRKIAQPSKRLKGLQSWILTEILNKLKSSDNCKGFEKGSNLRDNALPHVGANVVMTLDLSDFFPSVPARRVYGIFRSVGFNKLISTVLTRICTYEEGLPQGAPTSPKLANLVLWTMDLRLQGYVGKRGITYTRYADDLSFSANNPQKLLLSLPTIKRIVRDEGFELNADKTRIAGSARAKIVTGLIVNEDSVGVGGRTYKSLRAKIHHLTFSNNTDNFELLSKVRGWLSYLNSVDKIRYRRIQQYIGKLVDLHPNSLIINLVRKRSKRSTY